MSDKDQAKHEQPAVNPDRSKDNKSCETVHLSPEELRKISRRRRVDLHPASSRDHHENDQSQVGNPIGIGGDASRRLPSLFLFAHEPCDD